MALALRRCPARRPTRRRFWSAEDIQARWRENEALKRANSRLFNGPTDVTTNWTANIRIVLDNDPPLVHEGTADLWIVTAGTAVARTDGQLAGTGFRAYLIRFDTLGVVKR